MAVLSAVKMDCNSDSTERGAGRVLAAIGGAGKCCILGELEEPVFLIQAHPFPPRRAINSIGKIPRIVGTRLS